MPEGKGPSAGAGNCGQRGDGGVTIPYPLTLSYDYAVHCEAGFDYMYVLVDTVGDGTGEVLIDAYTGNQSGNASYLLNPGMALRDTPGPFAVIFQVKSDDTYSDEDGLAPTTCGHSALDDITLSGAVTDMTNFESGSNGWSVFIAGVGLGDFTNVAAFPTLDPPVVPCPTFEDSVLVFFTPSNQHWNFQDNMAVSPWIDLKRGGDAILSGRLLEYDIYSNMPYCDFLFIEVEFRWYPYACPVNGRFQVSPFAGEGILYYFGESPVCVQVKRDFSGIIPPEAEQLQVAWGVRSACINGCTFNCCCFGHLQQGNQSPYVDNVRFGVYGTPTSAVPEVPEPPSAQLMAANPNPVSTNTRIGFTTPAASHAKFTVFDVAGRHIRTLVDSPMPAGPHEVTWDARNDAGQRVVDGLYYYRLTAGEFTATRKMVVVR